ncbi:MAG TPA: GNAT family N-acetyltransferase [Acidobacteriota bacterium]|nr:GNAT family N-acetyltransferase [Acidobacteriota bacterium]HNT17619.1 GNAT family N-acetyltransferase [Acidobacteriota bacterium]
MKYIVRRLNSEDIGPLTAFFIKAYGKTTPFRSKQFLKWYFKFPKTATWNDHDSWVAVDSLGNVVSHYGCLAWDLIMNGRTVPIKWGVNAYTLPEWRGKGINSAIVEKLMNSNDVNGVIGFTRATAEFYEKIGYNMFEYERMKRFVFVLDEMAARDVVRYIGKDDSEFAKKFRKKTPGTSVFSPGLSRLSEHNFDDKKLALRCGIKATTLRNEAFLKWRYIDNPFIEYELLAREEDGEVMAIMASRRERLEPLPHEAYRIVDLFGSASHAADLLGYAVSRAAKLGCIYVDFSMAGAIYSGLPESRGFTAMDDDECVLLPQVSSPISSRPNHEYYGLQSVMHRAAIGALKKEDIYLTRADSDRDRLGNVPGSLPRRRING